VPSTAPPSRRNAEDPGHRAALEASGLTALVTGTRSRAFDDAAHQRFAP